MDYTNAATVKQALKIASTTDDTLIGRLVTAASRWIDREVTGESTAENYFLSETLTDEIVFGRVDNAGQIKCWPHKSKIATVTAFSYRYNPLNPWTSVGTTYLSIRKAHEVIAWVGLQLTTWATLSLVSREEVECKVSYTGGSATDTAGLPADLVECATLLACRLYREDESGVTDSIGLAEQGGTLLYTKAMPVRAQEMLMAYKRVVPW